MSNVKLLIMF